MATWKKLYERIQRNPKHVAFDDLDNLLRRAGFERRQPRSGSSHYTYTKGDKLVTIAKATLVKPVYVLQVLELLEGELPNE